MTRASICVLAVLVTAMAAWAQGPDGPRPLGPMERLSGATAVPSTQPMATRPDAATTQPDVTAELALPQRAAQRLKLGLYEEAERDFTQMLADKSLRADGAVGLARLYRLTGRYDQAAKTLADAEPFAGASPDWRLEQAELLAVRGQYEQALALAQGVLAGDEKDLRARWIAGEQLERLGRTDEAQAVYKWVDGYVTRDRPADAPGKTCAGMILDRYSLLIGKPAMYATMILQQLYQSAYEDIDREYWPARVAAGRLSLEKYKTEQAAQDLGAALKINPKAYEAHLGIGWALLEDWKFEEVEAELAAARQVNPAVPAVFELESALLLAQRRYAEAATSAQKALDVNPRGVEALALLAAAQSRLGDRQQVADLTRRAEAVNPRCADFYQILGEQEAAARQYDLAESCFSKAIERAPWDANPRTSLGMMYMQTGQEDKAGPILEKAFAIDRYNRRTYNTLTLLDELVAFSSIQSDHFIVKFNASTDAILGPYFRDYLEKIYAELCRDYSVALPRKAVVEVFPTHAQFSVRISGQSWIPTVGACTGWVVAMYSPQKMAGTARGFNWAQVLRHEFTHVVTLAATGNRIPHWFTEGLAVSQEPHPRPFKWVMLLSSAMRRDQLFKVGQIDWGFIRPRRPGDREMAYAQSQWMVEFIVDRFGYPAIGKLLKAYADGKTQPQAFAAVLGIDEEQFDKQFVDWARGQVRAVWRLHAEPILSVEQAAARVADNPTDADAFADLAVARLTGARSNKDLAEAQTAARTALDLNPNQPRALAVLGTILARDPGKWDQAQAVLLRLAQADPNESVAPRLLAANALKRGDNDQAEFWFQRLKLACPLDPTGYAGLAAIYLGRGQKVKALPELAELATREQSDPRYALQLASIYTELKQPDQAVVWLTEAMEIDPFSPTVHLDLASAYLELQRPQDAVGELKVAIQLKPDSDVSWARLAFVYDAQGKVDLARQAAAFAVKLNPASPAASLLAPHAPTTTAPASQPDSAGP